MVFINDKYQYEKINIANIGISNINLTETMDIFNHWIHIGAKKRVCVTPVNSIVWANQNKELADLYNSASLVLCDGVPILWAAQILKTPLKSRVTGLDLLPLYIVECYRKNYSMFFLGAKDGVAKTLKEKYETDYPGIKIVGYYSPPFAEQFSEAENTKIIEMINQAKPDILWVSLTSPKQDFWIDKHLNKLETCIAIGVGGAFEVAASLINRAPVWMQKMGLEWLYRFCKEPNRLFYRYFIEAPQFLPLVYKQWKNKRD